MNCQECKDRLKPEDPTQPFFMGLGHYLPALCRGCPNYNSKETRSAVEVMVKHITVYDTASRKPKSKYD